MMVPEREVEGRLREVGALGPSRGVLVVGAEGNGSAKDDEFLRYMRARLAKLAPPAAPSSSSGGATSTDQQQQQRRGVDDEFASLQVNDDDGEGEEELTSTPQLEWNPSQKPELTLSQARELLVTAVQSPLPPPSQQEIVSQLKAALDANEIVSCVSSSQLPGLVENNPLVALEMLQRLLTPSGDSAQSAEAAQDAAAPYLAAMTTMDLSLHSIDVVNRLSTAAPLPSSFIHAFITNCITSCEKIRDKYMQNRLVRLVCVFLQSLIRNKIVSSKDVCVEAQAFCVEFSRIREAAGLYKALLLETSIGT